MKPDNLGDHFFNDVAAEEQGPAFYFSQQEVVLERPQGLFAHSVCFPVSIDLACAQLMANAVVLHDNSTTLLQQKLDIHAKLEVLMAEVGSI